MKKRVLLFLCAALALCGCKKTIVPEISLDPRTSVLSPDGETAVTALACNCTWTAATSLDEVTVDPAEGEGDASVRITVPANNTGETRTVRVTFTAKGTEKTATAKYVVTQDAKPFVSFQTASATVPASGAVLRVVLESNAEWVLSADSDFLEITPKEGSCTQTISIDVWSCIYTGPEDYIITASLKNDPSVKSSFTITLTEPL